MSDGSAPRAMSLAEIEALLARMQGVRVLCVGDLILDRFVYGAPARVSREAPVVALSETERRTMLGACGNVARNIASLGGQVALAAVVGDDPESHEVSSLLVEGGFDDVELIVAQGRQTPVKTRYVASGQQVLCVDRDPSAAISEVTADRLIEAIAHAIADVAMVALSDYGRGAMSRRVIRAVIDHARAAGVPVVADPRGRDFSRYDGVTVLKPNAAELALEAGASVNGDEEAAAALAAVKAHLPEVEHLVLTRGGRGMAVLSKGAPAPVFHRSAPREVYDVSGAGDTTMAALALALAGGASITQAIQLANRAAGVVVTKVGTATVTAAELAADAREKPLTGAPMESLAEAAERVARWRADGLRIGLTNGCFDILHVGHLAALAYARGLCDRLVVGVNADASVARLKGSGRPINTAKDRARLLAALGPVDLVVTFAEDTAVRLVETLRPDVYVKGGDYAVDALPEAPTVRAYGGQIALAPLEEGRSTTALIAKLGEG